MFSSRAPKWNPDKTKVNLKMLINRINLLVQKQGNLAKAEKRAVATLLRDGKEQNARIKVEQIIRTDYKLESYDMIKQYTETLITRFNLLSTQEAMAPEIAEAVAALVYSGYMLGAEVAELKELFVLFTAKYGKEFTQEVIGNKDKYLNHRFNKMLSSSSVPDGTVVCAYLTEIAKAYSVEYIPTITAMTAGPVSATTGVALPLPGQAMGSELPGASPENPTDAVPLMASELMPGQVVEVPSAGGVPPPGSIVVDAVTVAPPVAQPVTPPVAQPPAAPPAAPAASPVVAPYTVLLTKRHPDGFGLSLDASNVVSAVKSDEARAVVAVGDRVLAFNTQPVSDAQPAKTFAIDCNEGDTATFVMLRGTSSPPPAPPSACAGPSAAAVGGGTSEAQAVVLDGLPPTALPVATPTPPPPAPTPPVAPLAPPAAPPPAAPLAPPAAPPPPEDPDDLLAKRLAALKRG